MIFGADGYIGWPLALHLGAQEDTRVILVDNFVTRRLVQSVGSDSLVPLPSMHERITAYGSVTGRNNLIFVQADARDARQVDEIISRFKPNSIAHLAQQRSAPFSMIDQEHALYTQVNNLATNLNILYSMARHTPKASLVKMGTMGEYGTPEVEITEGPIEIVRKRRKYMGMFPRSGQSWYHLSKVFDTHNVMLANALHGLRATDVMQGVVYGTRVDEITDDSLSTRFDFDSIWGTVINKYVVQAVILNKLLIYGLGRQTRGFLSLYDSVNCLTLLLQNPPAEGEYRVVNQLDETYDTVQLANKVKKIGEEFGYYVDLEAVANPRVEKERHFYEVERKLLPKLGFRREKTMEDVIREIFSVVIANKARADKMSDLIYPTVSWRTNKQIRSDRFRLPSDLRQADLTESPPELMTIGPRPKNEEEEDAIE
jgi:UDP-sulfoquinovose synthase